MQYNTIQYNTTQRNATQCNAMRCDAMRCDAMQCISHFTFPFLQIIAMFYIFIKEKKGNYIIVKNAKI